MIAFQIIVNGKEVAIAGVHQGLVLACANCAKWIPIPSLDQRSRNKPWHAHFSVSGQDNRTPEHLTWFEHDLQVGDEVSIRLIEVDQIDEPIKRTPTKNIT